MGDAKPAIEIHDLAKRFRREFLRRDYFTWKSLIINPFSRKNSRDYITVLDGVSLQVDPGKTLAIIGQNGSGKSTLLKIMAGIYKPDSGEVKVQGRMASLIELGAGFHPEFTGRENVFLNGTILGLSKREISARMEQIISYSGLGEYIDAPVRTYSSGMYVRLGFSVAVNVDPDVLLIDEVLAVGDEAFAHKCEDKINEFRRRGKTIVMVTHDLGAVEKYAEEVVWLDGGCIAAKGEALRVIDAYRQKVAEEEDEIRRSECPAPGDEMTMERWGDGDVVIENVRVLDANGKERAVFQNGEAFNLEFNYTKKKSTSDLVFGVGFFTAQDVQCYGTNTLLDRVGKNDLPSKGKVRISIDRLDFVQGSYFLDVAAHAKDGRAYDYMRRVCSFAVRSNLGDVGVFRPPHSWDISAA
jgi:lipopolysaccharide transport system ATP-binding protein